MKNDNGDGILCDYCGGESKGDFTYYSFDFVPVSIINKFTHKKDICLSADICDTCMELFRQRVLDIANKVPESPTRCDITGGNFGTNDQIFYQCNISSVAVELHSQPFVCNNCKKERDPQEGPCDCGDGAELVRDAKVEVDDKYLRLNFCEHIFGKFKAHIDYIHGLGDAEWSK